MGPQGSLSATNLAVHHHLNCDLYLHNVYHKKNPRPSTSTAIQDASEKALLEARYKRGLEWESTLYSWLDESNLLLKVPSTPVEAGILMENILADDRDHFFITGLTFKAPADQLVRRFAQHGHDPVNFGLAKPDLIEVRRTATGARWKVIDAKASQAIKTSHHVQIYFYSLCLQHLLMAPFFEAAGKAGVWLPPEDGFNVAPPSFDDIKSIDLSLLSPSLDTFLFDRLPRLLSLPKSRVKWHFNPLCSGCDYSAQCKRTVIREGRLGTMPNVSINDARVLQEFISLGEQAIEGFERNPPADIEDLHYLVAKKKRISVIESQAPITVQKVRKILALPKRIRRGDKAQNSSSVLDAARAKAVQIIPRRNFTCPSREDIAIVISLVQDPAKPKPCLEFFSISVFFEGEEEAAFSCNGPDEDFVPVLAATIRNVTAGLETPPSTQFYVWSTSEQRLLQSHLIKTALESGDDRSDIRLCIGTLAQGASLLRTTFQPMLLGGALLSFLGKSRRTKGEYQTCLRRMGLDTQGTVPELRARITTELKRLQSQSQGNGAKEAGQIAPVVVLKKEIERLLALPIPGYWDLRECCGVLLEREDITRVPTDDQILSAFKLDDDLDLLKRFLAIRNQAMRDVLLEMRNRIKSSGLGLLVNEGKPVSGDFMDICYNDHLSKLFFMQQFEVFSKLGELWASRIEGSPEAPILEYERSEPGIRGTEHIFHLVDGSIEFQSDRDHAFFDKLLVEDVSSDTEIPVESLFEDLAVAGFVFPLNKWTKPHWESQDARVRDEIRLADIRNMYAAGGRTHVVLRTWETTEKQLIPGRRYRLSSRLVDFNTQKVLATLFEADWQWVERDKGEEIPEEDHRGVPFLQLIMDPKSLGAIPTAKEMLKLDANIQTMFRRLKDLDVEAAGSLLLKPSQHRATQRMLTNRLTVIWGPPGTGKTHTIALSLLRLLEVQWKLNDRGPKIIFVTAMTHAAIDACLSKLERIVDAYRAIESLSTEWLDKVRIHRVLKGHDHPGPLRSGSLTHIYAGTLFQLYNFSHANSIEVDCVVADEAGQIALGTLSLVLRCLSSQGRIVIAGDSEQLAPIFTGSYPSLSNLSLFGSALDTLMWTPTGATPVTADSQQDEEALLEAANVVVQLTENFRLNPDLGEFVSTIYSRQFKPQKVQARRLALVLQEIPQMDATQTGVDRSILIKVRDFLLGLSKVMLRVPQNILRTPRRRLEDTFKATTTASGTDKKPGLDLGHYPVSLSLVRLKTLSSRSDQFGYETHVHGEAAVAAALIACIRYCCPEDDIFVATPHRIQREAVKAALVRMKSANAQRKRDSLDYAFARMSIGQEPMYNITVDTIERLQGSEASFVICLFSLPDSHTNDLGFLLERRRLNVAISRAKTLCVLVASPQVLSPPVTVFANEQTAKGFAFLKAYEERAWSYDISVNVDTINVP